MASMTPRIPEARELGALDWGDRRPVLSFSSNRCARQLQVIDGQTVTVTKKVIRHPDGRVEESETRQEGGGPQMQMGGGAREGR